jgi:hypothetical protein
MTVRSPPMGLATRWANGADDLDCPVSLAWCSQGGGDKNGRLGANAHALMATFGWIDIRQAELYTGQAERKRLASENAHLLGTNRVEIFPTLDPRNGRRERKGQKIE